MKHIMHHTGWQFSDTPFPAFRVHLVFGRNKKDFAFIPTLVKPLDGLLPEGKFRVIRTRKKGTIIIIPGEDVTDRALVMIGYSGGFRGGVYLDESTARILRVAQASNACESGLEVAALMKPGERLVVRRYGRRLREVVVCTLTEKLELKEEYIDEKEWEFLSSPANGEVL